jgi:hypothetical protein
MGNLKDKKVPNPGSDEAIKQGCTCPVLDNAHGKGSYRGGFFITADCPLHTKVKRVIT